MNRQVHERSPSLLSPLSVKQVNRIPSIKFEYYCARANEIRCKIYGKCKIQPNKHTHALRNEVMLVWDSLRLAPIIHMGQAHACSCSTDQHLKTHQFLLGTVPLVAAFHCTHSPTHNGIHPVTLDIRFNCV